MSWVLVIGLGWLLLAALGAVIIGRAIHLADARAAADADDPNFVVDTQVPLRGLPSVGVVPRPAAPADDAEWTARPIVDVPTIPCIPVARPPAPGAGRSDGPEERMRTTGLA